jgi:lysophospholipase L1-like esterase
MMAEPKLEPTTMKILVTLLTTLLLSPSLAQSTSPAKPALSPLDQWRASRADLYMNDFGELARYRAENGALKPPAPGENRVVFLGDSITDNWPLAEYFPGKPYINRGISGQTTSQMLVRFQQDVVALRPKAVVILAGTNDIAGNTGPMRLEDIEANFASLEELARANGIKVIFSSVLPVHNYTPESQGFFADRSPAKILELNGWLNAYCRAHACVYLDYFGAMVDGKGLLKKELAEDGLHPNQAGYKLMAPLAEEAITKALGKGLN